MKLLNKYQVILLVTLAAGYSQLFFSLTTHVASSKQTTSEEYKSPVYNSALGCLFYAEEEREGEEDRFLRKQTEPSNYFVFLRIALRDLTATTTITSFMGKVAQSPTTPNPRFLVLRL